MNLAAGIAAPAVPITQNPDAIVTDCDCPFYYRFRRDQRPPRAHCPECPRAVGTVQAREMEPA